MKLRAGFFEKIIKLINFHSDSLRKKRDSPKSEIKENLQLTPQK